MKKTTTLNLSNLQICPTDSVLNQETEFSIKRTARRYTFLIDTSTTHMNIKLTFNKENSTGKEEKSGLRQRISVMLYDATKYEVISETSFYAYLPKGIEKRPMEQGLCLFQEQEARQQGRWKTQQAGRKAASYTRIRGAG